MAATAQLCASTCLKMLREFVHASQGEFRVTTATGHPGHVLVLVVAVEPRKPGVAGVTLGALVAARVVYPRTSSQPGGISLIEKLTQSGPSALLVVVGRVGGGNDTTVSKRG